MHHILLYILILCISSIPIHIFRVSIYGQLKEMTTYLLSLIPLAFSSLLIFTLWIYNAFHGGERYYLGHWFSSAHYVFNFQFVVDLISTTYGLMTSILLVTVCYFSKRYLHKDPGFHRFYLLMSLFSVGLLIASFAGNIELLIIGWEIIGISSVMLISFFSYRSSPPKNALHVYIIYKCSDIAIIFAGFAILSLGQSSTFQKSFNLQWYTLNLTSEYSTFGLFIIAAVICKSALYPFSNWLPRAMEGPTPSSAIFYGALAVHLGPLLLLRTLPLYQGNYILSLILFSIGIFTVITSSMIWRVQSDVKSKLAYGSSIQLGLIVTEISLQFYNLALFHIVAHACYRTLQILRAPSYLHDYQHITQLLRAPLQLQQHNEKSKLHLILFKFSMERGFLDTIQYGLFNSCKKIMSIIIYIETFLNRAIIAKGISKDESKYY